MKKLVARVKSIILLSLICFAPIHIDAALPSPQFKFDLSSRKVKQGDTIKINIRNNLEIKKCTIKFNNKNYELFQKISENSDVFKYVSYLGIPRSLKAGTHKIKLMMTLSNNARYIKTFQINVSEGNFEKTKITFTGKKKKLSKNMRQLSTESRIIGKKFRTKTPYPYFNNKFIQPAKGKKTSGFGAYRVYNNSRTSRRHSGVDIANKTGTPIIASNRGKVILSDSFKSHGETIMIDHGYGIISIYNHLSKRIAKTGDIVKRGQRIGLMGATGVATGPHVHWGLSIQNTRVDPLFWLNNRHLY